MVSKRLKLNGIKIRPYEIETLWDLRILYYHDFAKELAGSIN